MGRTSGKLYMKFALFCERMIDSGYIFVVVVVVVGCVVVLVCCVGAGGSLFFIDFFFSEDEWTPKQEKYMEQLIGLYYR